MLLGFRVNPLTPRNDKYLIYPNSISLESHIKVMKMKEMIANSVKEPLIFRQILLVNTIGNV